MQMKGKLSSRENNYGNVSGDDNDLLLLFLCYCSSQLDEYFFFVLKAKVRGGK